MPMTTNTAPTPAVTARLSSLLGALVVLVTAVGVISVLVNYPNITTVPALTPNLASTSRAAAAPVPAELPAPENEKALPTPGLTPTARVAPTALAAIEEPADIEAAQRLPKSALALAAKAAPKKKVVTKRR